MPPKIFVASATKIYPELFLEKKPPHNSPLVFVKIRKKDFSLPHYYMEAKFDF